MFARWAAVVLAGLSVCAACTSAPHGPAAGPGSPAAASSGPAAVPRPGPVTDVSAGCDRGGSRPSQQGGNSEVEEAFGPPGYLYAVWIGCGGIGFARSADSGRHFGAARIVPGSKGFSWDPAVAVAADGTLYAAFMHRDDLGSYPVAAVSRDHGASFAAVHADRQPPSGNWGDRDFIAVRGRQLLLTWDYGPSASEVQLQCVKGGSCAFARGDLNVVIQSSTDGGATWGPLVHLEPGFPLGGGYGAPLVVAPDGRVDVLYSAHPTDRGTMVLHPGYQYFTSSADGTHWAASVPRFWPGQGSLSLTEWWIDGNISADAGGNLYATWDTQTAAGDIGWLSVSSDDGRTWSRPLRVTPDTDHAPHIVESAGGRPGVAYVAWQTSAPAAGYATYLRPFSIRRGWLAPAIRVSAGYGQRAIWPGDTFGICALPSGSVALTWGSAIGSKHSAIWSSVVTF